MVTYKVLLDERRSKSDGTYSIIIRITCDRKVSTINSGVHIKNEYWDNKNHCIKSTHANGQLLNKKVTEFYLRIQKAVLELENEEAFNFDNLRERISADYKPKNLRSLPFKEYSQQLVKAMLCINKAGNALIYEQGQIEASVTVYQQVISLEPEWSVPYYNLGLLYKYQYNWQLSYQYNQKAVELDPGNEAAWWNLGIAATMLLDWRTAREAWNHFGLNLEVSDEQLTMDLGSVPIRLNPDDGAEVVWCKRIDPARAIIYNVPLSTSGHRYGDTVLNDGAPQGYRISNGKEVPVFNELQLLTKSVYKTYSITIHTERQEDIDKLEELCDNAKVEFEDWSTVRMLCKQCSEGTPHETHDHDLKVENEDEHNIGLASISQDAIIQVLTDWRAITLCEHTELELKLE